MNLSCELPKLDCIKKPSKSDIDKLKQKNILPSEIIDRIFKDLEKEYNAFKKKSKSKSKSKSKTKSKTLKSKSKSKSKSKTRSITFKNMMGANMIGGELSDFKKNRITDMVILLVAGSGYWLVLPVIESWVLAMGILPTLCGQNMAEHVTSSLYSTQGMTCQARAERYNTIVTSLTGLITGSAWYKRNEFTKENLKQKYSSIHAHVKSTLFGSKSKPKSPSASASSRSNK